MNDKLDKEDQERTDAIVIKVHCHVVTYRLQLETKEYPG